MNTISKAEFEIAKILERLERDTDSVVDAVTFEDIEVTRIDDNRRRFARRAVIETHRLPGHDWHGGA
jgi:hypothetical protein